MKMIYIEKLIDLKKKVNFLNAKVKKIELNNNSFKQWIYLQICLKENFINLLIFLSTHHLYFFYILLLH